MRRPQATRSESIAVNQFGVQGTRVRVGASGLPNRSAPPFRRPPPPRRGGSQVRTLASWLPAAVGNLSTTASLESSEVRPCCHPCRLRAKDISECWRESGKSIRAGLGSSKASRGAARRAGEEPTSLAAPRSSAGYSRARA